MKTYDTLSEAVNDLTVNGYTEDFRALGNSIKGTHNKNEYQPEDLLITRNYHFEADTDPGYSTELYVVEANDGTKGTMVVSYSAEMSQNGELIQQIPIQR